MSDYPYLKKTGSAPFKDREVTKMSDVIKQWESGETVSGFGLIGVPLSKSSISHSGACFAPGTIHKALSAFSTYSIEKDIDLRDMTLHDFGDISMHVTDILQSQTRVSETMEKIFTDHPDWLPIVLGGDNSISFPTIKAFAKQKGTIGVIQFDAHHDVRNLEDGGPTNGTPFRSLLETNTIVGRNLVQVGIRDFSNSKAYRTYVEEHGVSIYTMKDVREKNITSLMSDVIADLKTRVDAIYLSIDMDVVDQSQAPGCPAIGPGGMDTVDLFEAVSYLGAQSIVEGIEIVEIDPTVDFRDMTSRVAAHVILHYLKEKRKLGHT